MYTFEDFKKEQFIKKPGLKKQYDALKPEFDLIDQIISARVNKGLSQKQLAAKMSTTQSAIARLESIDYNPSVGLLRKLAKATGTQLKIVLE